MGADLRKHPNLRLRQRFPWTCRFTVTEHDRNKTFHDLYLLSARPVRGTWIVPLGWL